ncbi:MAG: hypothetical protein OK422_00010 [Thaumarchaeota archaeon]|nr:hypothetical protein [Nitrososphaerota archaeon]
MKSKVPEPDAKDTVSPLIDPDAPDTVAVHVEGVPTVTGLEHDRAVVVGALLTTRLFVPKLLRCVASPPYVAVIV